MRAWTRRSRKGSARGRVRSARPCGRGSWERPGYRRSFFFGWAMSRPDDSKPLSWSEIAALLLLAAMLVLGLLAQDLPLVQVLLSLGFVAAFVLLTWLLRLTLQRAATTPPPTRRQHLFDLAVFIVWIGVIAAVMWGYTAQHEAPTPHRPGSTPDSRPPAKQEPLRHDGLRLGSEGGRDGRLRTTGVSLRLPRHNE
jgi:hypothetical protein